VLPFTDSSLVAVDFMATDLTDVILLTTVTYTELNFDKAATKADFRTSTNYSIGSSRTKIKRTYTAGLKDF
jgi:hypothetical protein